MNWKTETDFVVFDLEIKKGINELPNGWEDKHLMGISCAVAWDNRTQRYRIFDDNTSSIEELTELLSEAPLVVGFNHIRFDYKVLIPVLKPEHAFTFCARRSKANLSDNTWPEFPQEVLFKESESTLRDEFDILLEIWRALGKGPKFDKSTHLGYGLDRIARDTLGLTEGKTGDGASAPTLYQTGNWGKLVDYCLNDVKLTRDLFFFIQKYGYVITKSGKVEFK